MTPAPTRRYQAANDCDNLSQVDRRKRDTDFASALGAVKVDDGLEAP
jgi:hypothetical protein